MSPQAAAGFAHGAPPLVEVDERAGDEECSRGSARAWNVLSLHAQSVFGSVDGPDETLINEIDETSLINETELDSSQ